MNRTGLLAHAAHGLAFALSSLGCTLPLFLTVRRYGRGAAAAWRAVWGNWCSNAVGMGAVVSMLTVRVSLFGVRARARGAGRVPQAVSAVLLLATGGYIVYYWLSAGGILG